MQYLLGVDAGNSKTIALVVQSDGHIVGAGRSGCGDIYGSYGEGGEAAIGSLVDASTEALQQAGVKSGELAVAVFSAAGADWPEDFDYLRTSLAAQGLGRPPLIYNDAIGALRAGSPTGAGVVVAVGTGVATGARAADGRIWHSSFWQEAQGSIELARKALRAVYRADLGIDPPTALTAAVLAYFEQSTVEGVLHLLTARTHLPHPNLGGLTRILLDLADAGDATARHIVLEQGALLGDYALVGARKVGIEGRDFPLVLTGGVLRHPSPLLHDAIVACVHTTSPMVQPVKSLFEPVIGALLLAFEAAQIGIDATVLEQLRCTMPDLALFAT